MSQVRNVLLPAYAAMSGYTEKALRRKIEKGELVENIQWRHGPDGRVFINVEAMDRWVESHPRRASKRAAAASESSSATTAASTPKQHAA